MTAVLKSPRVLGKDSTGDAIMAKRHANRVGDLQSLFLRLEELVLANSGADEFEEILKLLIAKLWDERSGRPARFTPQDRDDVTTATIAALLGEADRVWPGVLQTTKPALTPEHLGVCVRALAPHRIADHDLPVLDGLFEFLVARAAKGAKGQFFTPRHVVEFMVRMMDPSSELTVLDPACGSGGFLIHVLNYIRAREGLSADARCRFAAGSLWGFDIDPRAIRVAKALMVLAGDGSANLIRLNALLRPTTAGLFASVTAEEPTLTVEDICRTRLSRHKGFDLILTNPPFAGEVSERQLLDSYSLGHGKPRVERDILFVERCVQLLKPGGRLGIVLPDNKFAASAQQPLRRWLLQHAQVLAVVGLGRNTFLPHTHQKASVLFLQKNSGGASRRQDYPIFFGISEREGKNSKGQFLFREGTPGTGPLWERVAHDLDEIVEQYRAFCRAGVAEEA